MQEALMASTARVKGTYTTKGTFTFLHVDQAKRILGFWEQAACHLPILRTTLVTVPEHGTLQVVRKSTCGTNALHAVTLERTQLTWRIHHALYDGASWSMILETVLKLSQGLAPPKLLPYSLFVQHLQERETEAAESRRYWCGELGQKYLAKFPNLPAGHVVVEARSTRTLDIPRPNFRGDVSIAVLLQLAFAMLLGRHSDDQDVVFGCVMSGRSVDLPGIDLIAGPTIAVVP